MCFCSILSVYMCLKHICFYCQSSCFTVYPIQSYLSHMEEGQEICSDFLFSTSLLPAYLLLSIPQEANSQFKFPLWRMYPTWLHLLPSNRWLFLYYQRFGLPGCQISLPVEVQMFEFLSDFNRYIANFHFLKIISFLSSLPPPPFLWPHSMTCGILVPQSGVESTPPAVETQNLNHQTAREVPENNFLIK